MISVERHHMSSRVIAIPSAKSPGFLVRVFDRLLAWQEWQHERTQLLSLTDRELRDIGLSRADVAREAEKPFRLYG
jgi:uncharacterized protein YjiS (DUF1127 family)